MLAGCVGIGPNRLSRDEIDFSRALAVSNNQQTLLNIVRLRYAEAPTFLELTQVISGYQTQQNLSGSFELFPDAHPSTYFGAGGSVQLQESPTFTYAPVTGDRFADTFLRLLTPEETLPLLLTGAPIDLLTALVAQSVGGQENADVLAGDAGMPSPGFSRLLSDLRALQVSGLLEVRFAAAAARPPGAGAAAGPPRRPEAATIRIRDGADPGRRAVAEEARRLLGVPDDGRADTIVDGTTPSGPDQVAISTRSILGVLSATAFAIDVPAADVAAGRTMPSIPAASPVRIRSGASAPADAFVSIVYDGTAFWISGRDFRSKLAFAILQTLLALAQTKPAPGALVTIPAG